MVDSIYTYIASLPDKRTALALSKVFERFIPRANEPVAAGFYANLNNLGSVTQVVTTKTVTAAENGSTFILSLAAGFVTTLPTPAAGLKYTFIVGISPTSSLTIVTSGSANIIKGFAANAAGAAVTPLSDGDTITLVANQAVAGDQVTVVSDGTSWFMSGFAQVAAGITNTKAS